MAAANNPRQRPKKEADQPRYLEERSRFKPLLLSNPNYFGNLAQSEYQPVLKIVGDTTYEQITCVGYNLNLSVVEATVHVNLPVGYGGNLCSPGTAEYVRFFVNYGAGWIDIGVGGFNAHDLPNTVDCARQRDKPLSYVVTLPFEPQRDPCGRPLLPTIRAILSWEVVPPAGNPNWAPIWGNVVDRHIQIKPRRRHLLDLADIIGSNIGQKLTLPSDFEVIQFEPLPLPDPPPLSLAELAQQYTVQVQAGEAAVEGQLAVEPHRFGFAELQTLLAPGALDQDALTSKIAEWQKLEINWQALLEALQKTQSNVNYEELHCLGLDYNQEWLVATITIKRPTGYSGTLCQQGSKEYVAFWADWDNSCNWVYQGTTAVEVHDIPGIPADGLHYTAVLKVNPDAYRQPCEKPQIARVRAVMSWNTPPSTTDPEEVPYWGNRLDAHVQIKPGRPHTGDEPEIAIIGGISVAEIDISGNGMTLPGAVFALYGSLADPHNPSRRCPFGGRVHVQAYAPPAFSALGYKYRVLARKVGTLTEIPVTTPFQIASGINPPVMRTPDPMTGFIEYVDPQQNIFDMLAWWDTSGDDLWEIRLEMVNAANVLLGSTAWHRVQLDNTQPEADIYIDSGGDCKDFKEGVTINGHFVARDINFGHFSLDTLPNSLTPPDPVPASGNVQTAPGPVGNPWTLTTGNMVACGYVIVLSVWDRTIVGSVPNSHNYREDDVGFCLREGE